MKRTSATPRPCYTALVETIDMRDLLHPDNGFVRMANDLDAAFGHCIQHAAWHKYSGRTAQEYLMVCIGDTALVFEGPMFDDMWHIEKDSQTRVAIVPYYAKGVTPAHVDERYVHQTVPSPTDYIACPTSGEALINFVKRYVDVSSDATGYTINQWRGPKPPDGYYCSIL